MTTEYSYIHFVIVPANLRVMANQLSSPIDPDCGGNKSFDNLPLSGFGAGQATHHGCSVASTENMKLAICGCVDSLPGVMYWTSRVSDMVLIMSNITIPAGQVWSWNDCLAESGLQLIVPDMTAE